MLYPLQRETSALLISGIMSRWVFQGFLSMVVIVDDVAVAHAYLRRRRPLAHSFLIGYCLVRLWAEVADL